MVSVVMTVSSLIGTVMTIIVMTVGYGGRRNAGERRSNEHKRRDRERGRERGNVKRRRGNVKRRRRRDWLVPVTVEGRRSPPTLVVGPVTPNGSLV
jgi:hypothetical protein